MKNEDEIDNFIERLILFIIKWRELDAEAESDTYSHKFSATTHTTYNDKFITSPLKDTTFVANFRKSICHKRNSVNFAANINHLSQTF